MSKELPNILFCEARALPVGVRLPDFDRDIWRRIDQKQDFRYQVLPEIPPDADRLRSGSASLLLDFKRYFTVPTDEVYRRTRLRAGNDERAERRTVLVSPYAEELSDRFYHYQARVAVPEARPTN